MDLKLLLTKLTSLQKEELIRLLSTEQMNSSTDKVLYCPKCGSFHLVKMANPKVINILFVNIVVNHLLNIKIQFLVQLKKTCYYGNHISK